MKDKIVIDIENKTIQEIEDQIKGLDNKLNYYLSEKERIFDKTQPKAIDCTKEIVKGGSRVDKFANYVIETEDNKYLELDKKINNIQEQIQNLVMYVENELRRIGEYEPLKKKVIELKEKEGLTWFKIAEATHYSDRQCRRIYKKYKNHKCF